MNTLYGKNYCTLYIVRHAQTEWKMLNIIQGQLDSPLTDFGIKQTKKLAQALKQIDFTAIFSSDLLRAKKTAEILKLGRKLHIQTRQALRERTFGEHDEQMSKIYTKKTKKSLTKYMSLSEEEKWKFKFCKGYESNEDLIQRFMKIIRKIAVCYQGKNVLVITHGGNLRTFLGRIGFADYAKLSPGVVKNLGYIKVVCDGVDFSIKEDKIFNQNMAIKSLSL